MFSTRDQAMHLENLIESIGLLFSPPGRMEHWGGGEYPVVLVDYAHTPDALYNALRRLVRIVSNALVCIWMWWRTR